MNSFHLLFTRALRTAYLFVWICISLLTTAIGQPLDMDKFEAMKARSVGPAGMSGRVTSIAVVHDDPRMIYLGTASGGLWKSESGGTDWQPIFDDQKVASIGAVAVYQRNPDIIWAGTGEGNPRNSQTNGYGIYKSIDGGKSWELMGLENTRNIHRVLIHPENPDVVYVGAQGAAWGEHPERGVYKTTDGGMTWDKVLYVNEKTGIADLVMDPSNPNKLVAAMWEFRRWPWFFKSGGKGSGLYVTFDGGKTWKERTHEDGLPKGELGRIGLAIAKSNPKRIYALTESSKNGMYRSDDGGFTWKQMATGDLAGNRPFYYSDIFVDPENENRVYSIHSTITLSIDGGKSFENLVPYLGYSGMHPDHHAFWIHPDDPNFVIEGNDGGIGISRDRGTTWRFAENLPLAQFYHINVDNEYPYNIYGGMQDNGSWRGPAYVWRYGGIRNSYWEEVSFGDGFDVVPDPEDPLKGYSMSQGGALVRYDMRTGASQSIRPYHPDGNILRFNWNAAIAQDPFDPATIYYGSQFVHKSTDRGDTWSIISPDLTTNDPEKQKQHESGGLTFDVTAAENYTSLISIAPSTLDKEVVWAGSDDGNVHVTQDGGTTWTHVTGNIKGLPADTWIAQIKASRYTAGEAVVVANNYRQHDYTPYLFHTRDFGETWSRLADEEQIWGYCLSFIQDPIEPRLMFLGTEYGLYVSVDAGENWAQWKHGYPTVSTMDLTIQEREHDLVIGTFGRAAYVLDDIRPLRAIATEGAAILEAELYAFDPPTAVQAEYGVATGTRFSADAMFAGTNRTRFARIAFYVKAGPAKNGKGNTEEKTDEEKEETAEQSAAVKDSVQVDIYGEGRKLINTFKVLPDTGMNRVSWNMRKESVPAPGGGKWSGQAALPGKYTLLLSYGGEQDSSVLQVISDPRLNLQQADLAALQAFGMQVDTLAELVSQATRQLKEATAAIELILNQLPEEKDSSLTALQKKSNTLKDSIQQIMWKIVARDDKQGIVRDSDVLSSRLSTVRYKIYNARTAPNANHQLLLTQVAAETQTLIDDVNSFFETEWKAYQEQVEAARLSPFKEVKKIERE